MKTRPSKLTILCMVIYFVILAAFFVRVCFFTDLFEHSDADALSAKYDYSEDWTVNGTETIDIENLHVRDYGGKASVTKALPDFIVHEDSLCFSTNNLKLRVYIDDELTYRFDTRVNLTGTGYGIAYHIIQLVPEYAGKTIRIEAETVFSNRKGGEVDNMLLCPAAIFRYMTMGQKFSAVSLSFLMMVFGLLILLFFFGMYRKNTMMRRLWALGLTAFLFGLWNLADTGIPQFLMGTVFASREIVYGLLHLAIFPMIYFVISVTRPKKTAYLYLSYLTNLLCIGYILFARFVLGMDMHLLVYAIYFSYLSAILWMIVILIDNEIYCRKRGLSSNLRYFYVGVAFLVLSSVGDMLRYALEKRGSVETGNLFRLGVVMFFISMAFQIFVWWSTEKASLERDRFVNLLLQNIMGSDNPDDKINQMLEYLCKEMQAERAYIFEENSRGTFDNTYEYCREGVTPQIDNLKDLPYEGVVDVWYEEYKKGGHILIYDLEKYREVSENIYQILKPQDINTLVTGPLVLNGEYIGFFGVDNPPADMMNEISEIIRLLMYFLSELVQSRDNRNELIRFSYYDALTGAKNRRAIREFEMEELDTSRSYGYMMCDINGLKTVNDTEGHDAGDALIKDVANCLMKVFGTENLYRMGGDEFAVYSYETSLQAFEVKVERARRLIAEEGHHVAIGISFAEAGDTDFHKHKTEADNRMYDDKRAFYSNGNDRRRR